MNIKRFVGRQHWLAILTAVMLVFGAVAMVPRSAVAQTQEDPYTQTDNVAICHAVNENSSNEFISESPSVNALFAAGHPEHQGGRDIIPSFFYLDDEDVVQFFGGLNFDAAGQAIYNNNCNLVQVTPSPTPLLIPSPTPLVIPSPTPLVIPSPTPTMMIPSPTPINPVVVVNPTNPVVVAPTTAPAPAKVVTAMPSTGTSSDQGELLMFAVAGVTALAMIALGIRKRTQA